MPIRDVLAALVVVFVWGVTFVVIKIGVETSPPLLLSALRFTFAAIPAVFFIRPPKTKAAYVIAYGVTLGVVQFGLLFIAMRLGLPTGLASLLVQAQVFFTIGFAVLALRQRPTRVQLIGVIVGCLGIAVIGVERATGAAILPFLIVLVAAAAPLAPARPEDAARWAARREPLLILDRVGNAHNLGAIARTAAFLGVPRILISDHPSSARPNDAAYRVAEGGLEFVDVRLMGGGASFLPVLTAAGYDVVGAAARGGEVMTRRAAEAALTTRVDIRDDIDADFGVALDELFAMVVDRGEDPDVVLAPPEASPKV